MIEFFNFILITIEIKSIPGGGPEEIVTSIIDVLLSWYLFNDLERDCQVKHDRI